MQRPPGDAIHSGREGCRCRDADQERPEGDPAALARETIGLSRRVRTAVMR